MITDKKVEVHITFEAHTVEWTCPSCGMQNEFELGNFSSDDTNVCMECGLSIEEVAGATEEWNEYQVTSGPSDGYDEDDEESE